MMDDASRPDSEPDPPDQMGLLPRRITNPNARWRPALPRPWKWSISSKGNLYTMHRSKLAVVFECARKDGTRYWAYTIHHAGDPDGQQIGDGHASTREEAQAEALQKLGVAVARREVVDQPTGSQQSDKPGNPPPGLRRRIRL